MELTAEYIWSQVITIIMYIFLIISYFEKEKDKVLKLNLLAVIANGIAFILLEAYTGLTMCIVSMLRNILFFIQEKNGKENRKIRLITFIFLITIILGFSIYTYDGIFSLFSAIATLVYTYSVWQTNTKIYRLLGIPTSVSWIIYDIYVKSVFSIILESILLLCSATGYYLMRKKEKNDVTDTKM